MTESLRIVRTFVVKRHALRILILLAERLLFTSVALCIVVYLINGLFSAIPLTFFPLLMDGAVAVAAIAGVVLCGDLFLLHRLPLLSTVRVLEKCGANHPLLALSIELANSGTEGELCEETYRRAALQIDTVKSLPFLEKELRRVGIVFCILVAAVAGMVLYPPELAGYWKLPFTPAGNSGYALYPGTVDVPKYSRITLVCMPKNAQYPSCKLVVSSVDLNRKVTHLLRPDSTGRFELTIDSITSSIVYQFSNGGLKTPAETIKVISPPSLHAYSVSITPPAYTRLRTTALPAGRGDISAYEGSEAVVTLRSERLSASSVMYAGDTVALMTNDSVATGRFKIHAQGSYSIQLCDTFAQWNRSAAKFSVSLHPDEVPSLRFIRPGKTKDLSPAQVETLLVEGSDDLGIMRVTLHSCKGSTNTVATDDLSPAAPQTLYLRQFVWKLTKYGLYPGDTLFYWATATDTKTFDKKHSVVTDTFFFRIPTFEEIHRAMAVRDNKASDLISGVEKKQQELQRQVEQLDKATKRSDKQSWDRQQLASAVEKTMRAQADSLQKALDELDKNAEKMRNEGVLGEDIAKKMEEIQKAVKDLIAQYGDTLFPKTDQKELSLDDIRQAVDKLQQMLPDLSERLDNTLKYLEALRRDRELAMLSMRAEKLAQEQAQLAQEPNATSQLEKQRDLLDRIDALKKEAKNELGEQESAEERSTMQQINSTGAEMREEMNGMKSPSKSSMQQMSGSLAALAQKLREKTNAFQMQQMEALKKGLVNMSGDFLSMAQWQDAIKEQASSDEASRRDKALSQQALAEALGLLRQKLDSLPMLPPTLRQKLALDMNAAREAGTSTIGMMNNSGDGSFGMQVSAHSLRKVAQSALDMVDAMNNQSGGSCESGGGMQESLRKMSGKQAAINAATAQLLRQMLQGRQPGGNEPGGEGEGSGKNEQARKEAQEAQKALAEELKKLGEKFGDASGDAMKKRVEELEKEARSLARMLSDPREEVTEHQDRFLARMLQSALSLHREEEGKEERKSKRSENIFFTTEGTYSDSLAAKNDTFHRLRLEALKNGNYPPSYRSSINAYFDSLGVLYLR